MLRRTPDRCAVDSKENGEEDDNVAELGTQRGARAKEVVEDDEDSALRAARRRWYLGRQLDGCAITPCNDWKNYEHDDQWDVKWKAKCITGLMVFGSKRFANLKFPLTSNDDISIRNRGRDTCLIDTPKFSYPSICWLVSTFLC